MFIVRRVRSFMKLLFRREAVEAELDSEVQEFYQTMVDRYIERGVPEQEARRLARLKFGSAEQAKEEVRESRTGSTVESMLRDVRYALRAMRKTPSFALVTILALAIGIGSNATIFSVVSRCILQHPPVGDPSTLMALHTTHDGDQCCNHFSWPLFTDLREQNKSFSGISAYYELVPASMGGGGEPERVWGQAVSSNFFDVAKLGMAMGRGFTPREETAAVVVLGHGLWQRRFAADANIAGKTIRLSGRPFTVVGVAPPSFRGLDFILDCQFWVPLGNLDQLLPNTSNRISRSYHWLAVAGRLKPGVSSDQTVAELAVLAGRFARVHPESDKGLGFRFEEAGSVPPREKANVIMFLAALSAVALLVLCIACTNVANLSLAQASGRRREMAVRLALGATRRHLLRQILTENLLLAFGGGLLGVAISFWATHGLAAFHIPAPVPLDLKVSVDWRVLLYTFGLSLTVGILFGLAPAWAVARPLIANGLKGDDALVRPGRLWSVRSILVVSQIAMSLVLLCATGLFLRSLKNASGIDVGFRSRGILTMSIDPRLHGYSADKTVRFLEQLRHRVAALPGVVSVAYTDAVPLYGGHRSDGFEVEGRPNPEGSGRSSELYMASPAYFQTMGIPKIAGRDFANDAANAPRIAVVNKMFAQTFFGNENPLGQRVRDGDRVYQIIGLVGNTKSRSIGEDFKPVLYRALAQDIAPDPSFTGYSLLVQYGHGPGAVANAVRQEIHALDPTLAVFNLETMEEHLRNALVLPRLTGTLFGIFGFIGLSMAAVGLYGVMSYWVSQRTREIGIRLAVGARNGDVQRLIIRQGMTLTAIAIFPGLAAAWMLAKLLTSFLYGVPAHDAATFAVVPLFLAATAFLACWLPSRRAAAVDPIKTLRHE
jgi:predicted permease